MKIFVIGATGMAGSAIVGEAVKNNISVVANGENEDKLNSLKAKYPNISILAKNAFDLEKNDFYDIQVVIDAAAFPPKLLKTKNFHLELAKHLFELFVNDSNIRIGFILGAGSLKTGKDNHLVYDNIIKLKGSEAWSVIPLSQVKELEFLKNTNNFNWFGISPANTFEEGRKSDNILTGTDHLLVNSNGDSFTTSGTMATIIIKEILNSKHKNERFTVANG